MSRLTLLFFQRKNTEVKYSPTLYQGLFCATHASGMSDYTPLIERRTVTEIWNHFIVDSSLIASLFI
jgi:hypothetical protein